MQLSTLIRADQIFSEQSVSFSFVIVPYSRSLVAALLGMTRRCAPRDHNDYARKAANTRHGVSGIAVTSTPSAWDTAFAIAGAVPMIGGSASPFAPM